MKKDEFLNLAWTPAVRQQLEAHMAAGRAEAYSAEVMPNGKLRARVWAENPGDWDTDLVYEVPPPESEIEAPAATAVSRTQQAIRLMEKHGWTAYRACKAVGVSQSAVSRSRSRKTPPARPS